MVYVYLASDCNDNKTEKKHDKQATYRTRLNRASSDTAAPQSWGGMIGPIAHLRARLRIFGPVAHLRAGRASSARSRVRMSPKMNAKTSGYRHFFSPKIGGDTEGVENLIIHAHPTFCHSVNVEECLIMFIL